MIKTCIYIYTYIYQYYLNVLRIHDVMNYHMYIDLNIIYIYTHIIHIFVYLYIDMMIIHIYIYILCIYETSHIIQHVQHLKPIWHLLNNDIVEVPKWDLSDIQQPFFKVAANSLTVGNEYITECQDFSIPSPLVTVWPVTFGRVLSSIPFHQSLVIFSVRFGFSAINGHSLLFGTVWWMAQGNLGSVTWS